MTGSIRPTVIRSPAAGGIPVAYANPIGEQAKQAASTAARSTRPSRPTGTGRRPAENGPVDFRSVGNHGGGYRNRVVRGTMPERVSTEDGRRRTGGRSPLVGDCESQR